MSNDVKIPVPNETELAYIEEWGKSTEPIAFKVRTVSRQEYDAKLVSEWYEKHKDADVQVFSEDTKMPLYALYATPLAYHDDEAKAFFRRVYQLMQQEKWEEL